MAESKALNIAVIGLGYVGLPLAVAFGKQYRVIGFDINSNRINQLIEGYDETKEVDASELKSADLLSFTSTVSDLADCDIYIVTVPTPIDNFKRPDLKPLISASEIVGGLLKQGDLVIYESTVYPGATEDDCVPVLEKHSGLVFNNDFFVGYSPERINPGDKNHRLQSIRKVTSGSTAEVAKQVDQLYKSIISAGTHLAPSIKVAEAAKVIENTQRDVNIALINELAVIFERLNIDTMDVLEAAGTKWNFLPFRPGLVGGHCIGVDPYYLTHKAQSIGYQPEMILAGRRINDGMGNFVATNLVKQMCRCGIKMDSANILILGLTFKENCPDLRNTKVVSIINELESYGLRVDVHDPQANAEEARRLYNIDLTVPEKARYSAIVLAVAHDEFTLLSIQEIKSWCHQEHVIYDLKNCLPRESVDLRL